MKKYTLLFFVAIFVVCGEVLVRVTSKYKLFEKNRVEKINITIGPSAELELYKNNQIDLSDSSLRILVIGDSYIHGGGINPKDKISNKLREYISTNNSRYKHIYILDVSVPNSNNLDNMNTYFKYKDGYLPQIVVLGYHYNDINGNLSLENTDMHDESKLKKPAGAQSKMMIRKFTDFLYNSAVLEYFLPKMYDIALSMGYIVPKCRLDNTLKYYVSDHKTWKQSKEYLARVFEDSDSTLFIEYHFALTNLIEFPELFTESNTAIESFFSSFDNVKYISGTEHFRGKKAADYFIYKFDGHPNAKAHLLISEKINEVIKSYTAYNYPFDGSTSVNN